MLIYQHYVKTIKDIRPNGASTASKDHYQINLKRLASFVMILNVGHYIFITKN